APFPINSAASSRMSLSCHDAKLAFMKNRTSKSQTFFSLSKIWGAVQFDPGHPFVAYAGKAQRYSTILPSSMVA
ncbi:hypothetical protein, partial [Senegalimassilia anaerobia]|uniref:hypothetical protein n=1 Tax=Senegalimassilia anaerobia TaxID=1473216 RepID=UPI003A8EB4A6